ncbi:MAG: CusA/CzcA family heavy metal efflux RND transporter [Bacteroidetes bacterium]|nr:CusA/CzcA family heavy metal efflux RND transporter [Bacteroidota bacterium]
MFDKIIDFSIRNKIAIGIMTVLLIIAGIYSIFHLQLDAIPDITNNQVQVITIAPTLASSEVEQLITYPIEKSVATIPEVIELRSVSRFGLSVVTVVFNENVDIYRARQQISEKLRDAEKQIPAGIGEPELAPISTGLGEIYQYLVKVKPGYESRYSLSDLRTIQDWIVKRQLLGTPGVAEVSSLGGYIKQYEVALDPNRLHSMGISISEIFTALEKNNENTGAAYLDQKPYAYFIRGIGFVHSLNDIEKIAIKTVNNMPVLIRDVGKVSFGHANRYGAVVEAGKGEATGGMVMMLKGENSVEVIERVKNKINLIGKSLPEGVYIDSFIDRTKLIDKTINTVTRNLLLGGLIVIFVLTLLIGNLRAGFIVASVIPLAMLFAIIMMVLTGVSGNLMSLGAIDFGIIVDGAVIIVESVVYRLFLSHHHAQGVTRLSREQMDEEVGKSAKKMMRSATFGQIIILIVYLPVISLSGIEGKMFKPMAETVMYAVLGAFILSLTYVPVMSSLFLSRNTKHTVNISDRIMEFCHTLYKPAIRFTLNHRISVIIASVLVFAIAVIMFLRIDAVFVPSLEEGDLLVLPKIQSGSSLSQSIETYQQVSDILKKEFPEVRDVVAKIGVGEIPTDPTPMESADIVVCLKDKKEWVSATTKEELIDKMKEKLSGIPGVSYEFMQPIEARFNELMTGIRSDVAVKIFGDNMDTLSIEAEKLAGLINKVPGIGDMKVEQVVGLPQVIVKYNRDRISADGLNIRDLNKTVRTAFAGEQAGLVYEGEKRFDLVVRLDQEHRNSIEDVRKLFVPLPSGQQIPLEQLADVEFEDGPQQIARDEGKRRITIGINVRNRDVGSLITDITKIVDHDLKLPPGYYVTYGGQFENLVEAKKRLAIAVPFALFLILVLLYMTFRSLRETLLVFSVVPFAAIGGVFALYIRGIPFSVSAGVGFIALFGVAVLNGIVLISSFNQLRDEGIEDITQRVIEGTRIRLRPVLMTASVASLGFLPMAISHATGSEVQRPLATVVFGGLITATILTLIILPAIYSVLESKWKPGKRKSALIISLFILLLIIPSNTLKAQQRPRVMSLKQCIDSAMVMSPAVKATALEKDYYEAGKKAAIDIPKTELGVVYGQSNSINNDDEFNIRQNIEFPTVYVRQKQIAKSLSQAAGFKLAQSRNELSYQVRILYCELLCLNSERGLLRTRDSLYTLLERAGERRFRAGETGSLEKMAAQAERMQVHYKLRQNEAQWLSGISKLKSVMNYTRYLMPDTAISLRELCDVNPDTGIISENPALLALGQETDVAGRQVKLEQAKLLPDISIGYFNKSLIGIQIIDGAEQNFTRSSRFSGITGGLTIPVFFGAQGYKIKAAGIERSITQQKYLQQKNELEAGYASLLGRYRLEKEMLLYYGYTAVPHSSLMIADAGKSMAAGEIAYPEYLKLVETALEIRCAYIDIQKQYFNTVSAIQLIRGTNE